MTCHQLVFGSYYEWVELSTGAGAAFPACPVDRPGGEGDIGFDIYADLGYNGRCLMTEVNGP